MRSLRIIGLACCLALACSGVATAKGTTTKRSGNQSKASSKKVSKKSKAKPKKGAWKRRGQQSIDSQRTVQIQQALISAGYLKGEPSGKMDTATKQALVRLQGDNGWQTKVVPDSRALIKLGLGPDHSNLLNPDTAMLPVGASTAQSGTPQ